MSIIEEKCKQKGVRLTDQRKVIAKVLSESKEVYGSKDHPDVDELHKRVSALDDKISIATVYRTVKLFEEAGILVKHDFKAGKARYEINDDHNHLIDINSGEIVEFVDKDIEELQKKIASNILLSDIKTLDNRHSGKYISNVMYDTHHVKTLVSTGVLNIMKDSFSVIGLVSLMFYQNWKLALFAIMMMPLAGGLARSLGKRMGKATSVAG